MLITLVACRCYEAEDSFTADSLKNRKFNAFSDPGKSRGILFEANGSTSRMRIEAKWCSSNQWSNFQHQTLMCISDGLLTIHLW